MALNPNWIPVSKMPDDWKDGRPLLGWWYDTNQVSRVAWRKGRLVFIGAGIVAQATHVSSDTIAGPGCRS